MQGLSRKHLLHQIDKSPSSRAVFGPCAADFGCGGVAAGHAERMEMIRGVDEADAEVLLLGRSGDHDSGDSCKGIPVLDDAVIN